MCYFVYVMKTQAKLMYIFKQEDVRIIKETLKEVKVISPYTLPYLLKGHVNLCLKELKIEIKNKFYIEKYNFCNF